MTGPQLITAIAFACMVSGAWAEEEVTEVTDPASFAQVVERDALEPAVSGTALAAGQTQRMQSAAVMDELDLRRTEITGNQELPKVLYIVPWQKSDPGSLLGRPANTLLDEVLAPLDREEFIRQVDYYSDLHAAGDE